jgi:hypothetical protein
VAGRAVDYAIKDTLPGDNRQDFAVEVLPALPVLLVDGDTTGAPKRRGTDFLRDALALRVTRRPWSLPASCRCRSSAGSAR